MQKTGNGLMLKQILAKTIFLFLLFGGMTALPAQDVSLKASVNRNQVNVNQRFEYKIEVSGSSRSLPDPELPEFKGLNILSGPNVSTSIQIVNGAMSSSKTYSYYLYATAEGEFKIPAVALQVNGRQVKSNEITVTVSGKATAQGESGQQNARSTDEDMLGENLYLKALVSKTNVFQNEQIVVEYKLYFRVQVRSYNFEKLPANPGFWTEEFNMPSQPAISTEIVNGIQYNVATLRKVALFPTESGELSIEPLVVSVDALVKDRSRQRSLFDSFFDDPFGRSVRKVLASETVKVKVKPLPKNGKPAGFDGAVGKFTMQVRADKTQLKANEAVSVKVNLSGEGNVKLLQAPVLTTPPDMEKYDPKEKVTINNKGPVISGSREIEYILVPRFEGEYRINPVYFSYFDPGAGKYRTLKSNALNISVQPGDEVAGNIVSAGSLSKQEVELLGEDIRFIKQTTEFRSSGAPLYKSLYYYFAYLLPVLFIFAARRYRSHVDTLSSDRVLARRRRAGKITARHLAEAKSSMKKDPQKFYNVITRALQGFVSDKLNIDLTDFTAESVRNNLKNVGVKDSEIEEYQACLEESDMRQFAGMSTDTAELGAFFNRVKNILTKLEKYI